MRSHGWDRDLPLGIQQAMQKIHDVNKFNDMYTFYVPGMNLRSTDLQAFIGLRSIQKLEDFSRIRWENFQIMKSKFADINRLNLVVREGDTISNLAFPLAVDNRTQVILNFKYKVETKPLIAGNLQKHPLWIAYGGKIQNLPNASMIHKHGLYLPNHQDIGITEVMTMAGLVHAETTA
jgi:CDP-6-deoxy-D-xylo-4-hexulose-3-dehydrase